MISNFDKLLNNSNFSEKDKDTISEINIQNLNEKEKHIYIHQDEEQHLIIFSYGGFEEKEYEIKDLTKEKLTELVTDFIINHESSTKMCIQIIAFGYLGQPDFYDEVLRADMVYNYIHSTISEDLNKLLYTSDHAFKKLKEENKFLMPKETFYYGIENYTAGTKELYLEAVDKFGIENISDDYITYVIVEDLSKQLNLK